MIYFFASFARRWYSLNIGFVEVKRSSSKRIKLSSSFFETIRLKPGPFEVKCSYTASAAGVHPKVVSEASGHNSVSITLNLYRDVTPDMQDEKGRAMSRLSGGSTQVCCHYTLSQMNNNSFTRVSRNYFLLFESRETYITISSRRSRKKRVYTCSRHRREQVRERT